MRLGKIAKKQFLKARYRSGKNVVFSFFRSIGPTIRKFFVFIRVLYFLFRSIVLTTVTRHISLIEEFLVVGYSRVSHVRFSFTIFHLSKIRLSTDINILTFFEISILFHKEGGVIQK